MTQTRGHCTRFVLPLFGLAMIPAAVTPAAAQVTYVEQTRRVEAIPDNDPPPTQTTGTTLQQASDFGPFNGAIGPAFYWGQEGYDYGGRARVRQDSTLAPTGVSAAGSLDVTGDTVLTSGRSTLDTTCDVAAASPYRLSVAYDYKDNDNSDSTGIDGLVELRRVEAGGYVTLVRREADFGRDLGSPDTFDTTDIGTLLPGRYRLNMIFQASSNQIDKDWSYTASLTVPEPTGAVALTLAAGAVLLCRRRV